jgi:spore cortex biosynthesis protein YabQ
METTASQPLIFLLTICGGILVGIAYDVYKGVRKAIKSGRWVTALLDMLFIITLAAIVVFVMFTANQGELRLYSFIGFAVGFALYMAGLSPLLTYIGKRICQRSEKQKYRKK